MANHKSAAKRARQSLKIRARNLSTKKAVRTVEKGLLSAISEKKSDDAQKLLRAFASKIDKAAKKGVFHARTASRKIGRLSVQVQIISK